MNDGKVYQNKGNAMKGRFAPSPTGYMHLGNVWIALLSYVSVRQQAGQFLLRIEDIDEQRSKEEYKQALLEDLEWLGLEWDEGPYYQSDRYALYDERLQELTALGLLYPCFCNRARLQAISSAPHRGEFTPHYDGHCRGLLPVEVEALCKERRPSYRLKVPSKFYGFEDRWQGRQSYKLEDTYDDFVVKRGDGMFAYHLAVVVDDIDMGVTEVIRGSDLLDATYMHLALYDVLGSTPPSYGHAPLLVDDEGYRLSKRQKSITVRELKALGFSPEMLWGRLIESVGYKAISGKSYGPMRMDQLIELDLSASVLPQKDITLTKFDIKV